MGKRAKCRRSRGAADSRKRRGCLRRGGRKEFRYWFRRPSTSWARGSVREYATRDAWHYKHGCIYEQVGKSLA